MSEKKFEGEEILNPSGAQLEEFFASPERVEGSSKKELRIIELNGKPVFDEKKGERIKQIATEFASDAKDFFEALESVSAEQPVETGQSDQQLIADVKKDVKVFSSFLKNAFGENNDKEPTDPHEVPSMRDWNEEVKRDDKNDKNEDINKEKSAGIEQPISKENAELNRLWEDGMKNLVEIGSKKIMQTRKDLLTELEKILKDNSNKSPDQILEKVNAFKNENMRNILQFEEISRWGLRR